MSGPTFPDYPRYPNSDLSFICAGAHEHGDSHMGNKDMSRGQMTAWICGTLLVLGAGALYFATRMDPIERNAECQTVFGMDDDCVLENARERIRGYSLSIDTVPDASMPDPLEDPLLQPIE